MLRPTACAITRATTPSTGSSAASATTRTRTEKTSANTPKVPTRESFMISRRRSGVYPPSESAVSANPSSWNAPVIMTPTITAIVADVSGDTSSFSPSQTIPIMSPITAPTTGNHGTLMPSARSSAGWAPPGRRVRNAQACRKLMRVQTPRTWQRRRRPHSPPGRSGSRSPHRSPHRDEDRA